MVGHATLLVQIAGLNILTDPVWSDRASPVAFAGPRRVTSPGIELGALPQIDAILLSHNHYDHLDRSEEHTSELQSLMRISYAVLCLKKQKETLPHIQNYKIHQ